jgi:hypothetical protein
MADYVYSRDGKPLGFIRGRYVYDMSGKPIGQVRDTHVHKMSGEYVGELYNDRIVDKGSGNPAVSVRLGIRVTPDHPAIPAIADRAVVPTKMCSTS